MRSFDLVHLGALFSNCLVLVFVVQAGSDSLVSQINRDSDAFVWVLFANCEPHRLVSGMACGICAASTVLK